MHIINPDKVQCMFKSKFDNLEQKETLFDFQGFSQVFSFSFFFSFVVNCKDSCIQNYQFLEFKDKGTHIRPFLS